MKYALYKCIANVVLMESAVLGVALQNFGRTRKKRYE